MIQIDSESAMQAFGEKLGTLLGGGEVIELVGDVGAGKTTLVHGLARGMGITETVQSPSFTISRVYDALNDLRLVHYDFYRLNEPGIMSDEISETINDSQAVVVIEWADAVKDVLPKDRLTLNISASGNEVRQIELASGGEVSKMLLEQLS